jgi:hypothetical protein
MPKLLLRQLAVSCLRYVRGGPLLVKQKLYYTSMSASKLQLYSLASEIGHRLGLLL